MFKSQYSLISSTLCCGTDYTTKSDTIELSSKLVVLRTSVLQESCIIFFQFVAKTGQCKLNPIG